MSEIWDGDLSHDGHMVDGDPYVPTDEEVLEAFEEDCYEILTEAIESQEESLAITRQAVIDERNKLYRRFQPTIRTKVDKLAPLATAKYLYLRDIQNTVSLRLVKGDSLRSISEFLNVESRERMAHLWSLLPADFDSDTELEGLLTNPADAYTTELDLYEDQLSDVDVTDTDDINMCAEIAVAFIEDTMMREEAVMMKTQGLPT